MLDIDGMTCAACVNRVEKALLRSTASPGTVNLAAETASVHFDPARVDTAALTAAVTKAGYTGTPPTQRRPPTAAGSRRRAQATERTPRLTGTPPRGGQGRRAACA